MPTDMNVRRPHHGRKAAGVSNAERARKSKKWGNGLGIKPFGELGLSGYNYATEVVHIGPFLRWLDQYIETRGHGFAMFDLGWDSNAARRLLYWRVESTQPYVPVAIIEDALHHVGVRLVDVYPETDVGHIFTKWCPVCEEESIVDASLICPWCETSTHAAQMAAA
ncbi:MAG: hypothetical protein ABSH36_00505 [Solirubrobacteraceae bacterium]